MAHCSLDLARLRRRNADTMPEGYSRLATMMGAHPEVAIYRRFGALNAQNLLYLQAELVDLENQLRDCERSSASSDKARDWKALKDSAALPDPEGKQWRTFSAIRKKLDEYSTAPPALRRLYPSTHCRKTQPS